MKTTRLLLAALSLATLAACSTDPITGSSPENARREIAPSTGGSSTQSTLDCAQVVVSTDLGGNSGETCVTNTNEGGPYTGSGG